MFGVRVALLIGRGEAAERQGGRAVRHVRHLVVAAHEYDKYDKYDRRSGVEGVGLEGRGGGNWR